MRVSQDPTVSYAASQLLLEYDIQLSDLLAHLSSAPQPPTAPATGVIRIIGVQHVKDYVHTLNRPTTIRPSPQAESSTTGLSQSSSTASTQRRNSRQAPEGLSSRKRGRGPTACASAPSATTSGCGDDNVDDVLDEFNGDDALLHGSKVRVQWPCVDGALHAFTALVCYDADRRGRSRRPYELLFEDGDRRWTKMLHVRSAAGAPAPQHAVLEAGQRGGQQLAAAITNSGQRWKPREVAALIKRRNAGEGWDSLCTAFGRSKKAVSTQYRLSSHAAYAPRNATLRSGKPGTTIMWRRIIQMAMLQLPGHKGSYHDVCRVAAKLPAAQGHMDCSPVSGFKSMVAWRHRVSIFMGTYPEFVKTGEKTNQDREVGLLKCGPKTHIYRLDTDMMGALQEDEKAQRSGGEKRDKKGVKKALDYIKAFRK